MLNIVFIELEESDLADLLMIDVYNIGRDDDDWIFNLSTLNPLADFGIENDIFRSAGYEAVGNGWIHYQRKIDIGEITKEGIEYVEAQLSDEASRLNELLNILARLRRARRKKGSPKEIGASVFDDESSNRSLPQHAIFEFVSAEKDRMIEASDRYVTLNHNSPDYKDALDKLNRVILDFKEDHRRDNEFVSEKSALLKTLEAGQELLQDVRVSVSATVAVLINPLRYIAQRYEKEIVGASAAIALTALAKMLGLL